VVGVSVSELVVLTMSPKRYFDLDAVRTEHKYDPAKTSGNGYTKGNPAGVGHVTPMPSNPAGAPPLDTWIPLPEEQAEWDRWAKGDIGTPSDYQREGQPVGQARYIIGDSLTVLGSMPDASVDLVLTSPPFLALRSYLPADHPDKAKELGSEPTPGEFIDALLDIVEECRRVLAPHGSLAFELGDTYSGSGGGGGDYQLRDVADGGRRTRRESFVASGVVPNLTERKGAGWPLDKSLCLIPELFRIALVYGFNPLTGRETPRWRARNVVRWHRPNPPVGALGDKFRPATSDMVVVCMSGKRYFDLDAVRHEQSDWGKRYGNGEYRRPTHKDNPNRADRGDRNHEGNPAGAPPLDTWEPLPEEQTLWDQWADDLWTIPTAPYRGSHYATFPPALVVRPIEAMCPRKVCRTCGEPSRRIVEELSPRVVDAADEGKDRVQGRHVGGAFVKRHTVTDAVRETSGWTSCGHDDWRNGVVLDPFAGSGTTLAVATGHGRDAIGIDLDSRNALLAEERIGGMFLTVEHHTTEEPAA
jgi:DNA modification methylase